MEPFGDLIYYCIIPVVPNLGKLWFYLRTNVHLPGLERLSYVWVLELWSFNSTMTFSLWDINLSSVFIFFFRGYIVTFQWMA